jgi:hypothetical protein
LRAKKSEYVHACSKGSKSSKKGEMMRCRAQRRRRRKRRGEGMKMAVSEREVGEWD